MPNRKLFEKKEGLCDYCEKPLSIIYGSVVRCNVGNLVVCSNCSRIYRKSGRLYRVHDMSGKRIGTKQCYKEIENKRKETNKMLKEMPTAELVKLINDELEEERIHDALNPYIKRHT